MTFTIPMSVLAETQDVAVLHVYGDSFADEKTVWWSDQPGGRGGFVRRDAEGIVWLHGHHADDSVAVAALRVARALSRAA